MNSNRGKFIDANKLYDTVASLERVPSLNAVWANDVLQVINTAPRCEVVPKKDYGALLEYKVKLISRLTHLLKSKFIRSFDEVIPFGEHKGEYKRDIREADQIALSNDNKSEKGVSIAFVGGYKVTFNYADGYDAFCEKIGELISNGCSNVFFLDDITINLNNILYIMRADSQL